MDQQQSTPTPGHSESSGPSTWGPLRSTERRVLGVMVEKSKTTPDIYPMTVNAIATGSNQKNNRKPQMQLTADDVVDALTGLRDAGVVTEIHGDGRAVKYRHHLYDWLGVDRVELAVMAELFLRGEQTMGDLRGRASRMEKIPDLAALKLVLASLTQKNLVIALTAPGRGQKLTHNLYLPEQLVELHQQYGDLADVSAPVDPVTRLAHGEPAASQDLAPVAQEESVRREQLEDRLAALEERVARLEQQLP
ncbi:MAG: YceH family protein [Mariniblastus sp.]|nr:YceH family protein [Mariniblastus sp.]